MDAEQARAFLLSLPNSVETTQWGDNLVFWVGDKAIGGKMFALINLGADAKGVISYSAGPAHYAELLESEGIDPAPYMARIYWVAVAGWSVFRTPDWKAELSAAHALTFRKLPPRTRRILDLPRKELKHIVAKRRAALAAKISTR